ncbi:MAG: sugar phosphate nucleotidyltransferase [Kiritimatiellaeota bacterium]|nr:sugar phosphate nucleotidyltransferase [Kiritimatiellota bacterium]
MRTLVRAVVDTHGVLCRAPCALHALSCAMRYGTVENVSKGKTERFAIILAGGRGERFWPMSRTNCPKPFVSLFGGKPLLRHAVERLEGVVPWERIIIVTMDGLAARCRLAVPEVPPENILDEPMGRDTAAACALGTALAAHRAGKNAATVAILTADHFIADVSAFHATLSDAFAFAEAEAVFVTMGVEPTSPETGYGYIEVGRKIAVRKAASSGTRFHAAKRFVEKPDETAAAAYLASGRFLWNSGMFVWTAQTFRAALAEHCPGLSAAMRRVAASLGTPRFPARLRQAYEKLPRVSIDYALMEKVKRLAVARCAFGWDDVGNWAAIERHFTPDADGNVLLGSVATLDARRATVVSDPSHLVAVLGLDDIVVVHTKDATLVCPKSRSLALKALLARIDPKYL